jgi:hypothetical protein
MKTDLERFIELYKIYGITLIEETATMGDDNFDGKKVYMGDCSYVSNAPSNEKFGGYGGFHSVVFFTTDGKFVKQIFTE